MSLINIYLIENLDELKCRYRLFKVKGLDPSSEDFDKNVQFLSDKLSRGTKSPCEILKENDELFLAQPLGHSDPPSKYSLVRANVQIDPTGMERELSFGSLKPEDTHLALRFLKFYLDSPLHNNLILWRPGAGKPFYLKLPDEIFSAMTDEVEAYRGFKFRPVHLSDDKIGVCVDLSMTYVAKHALPSRITPDEFRKYKGKHCIYEYGNLWYEVRIEGLSGLNVSEVQHPDGLSLFDHLHSIAKLNKPKSLQTLPRDGSVLTYKKSTGEIRNIPSGLCRLVCTTNHPAVSEYHSRSIMPPAIKKNEIDKVIKKYLSSLNFMGIPIVLSEDMLEIKTERFLPPDLKFGNGKVLSVKGTQGSVSTTLDEFGAAKNRMLYSTDGGFFSRKPLDKQYIILPRTFQAKFGDAYVNDLKEQFKRIYGQNNEYSYDPSIVSYDDSVNRDVYTFGNEILHTAETNCLEPGFAFVIIPRLRGGKGSSKEDELANLIMRELRKKEIFASVAHTENPSRNYVPIITADGQTLWQKTTDATRLKRFRGYLSNVVLNKILLLNSCWPFVLAKPMHADLTIGIDVKGKTAGFTMIFKDGHTLSFHYSQTDQKEQLSRGHLSKRLHSILRNELENEGIQVKKIVIHRDGKVFPEEIKGIQDALGKLANEQLIDSDYDCNVVEVRKSLLTPVRFFETETYGGSFNERIENPLIGTYKIIGDHAFLCNTGRPFKHPGTTKPLQIIKVTGKMEFKMILEDLFNLANLTWTKIDDCSREPITIKITDIRLREIAGDYDQYELEFSEENTEDE